MKRLVQEERTRYQVAETVFNKDYVSFLCNVMLDSPCSEQRLYTPFAALDLQKQDIGFPAEIAAYAPEFECWKFFIKFVTNAVLRLKKDAAFPLCPLLAGVQRALGRSVGLSIWLLENFSQRNIVREFLLDCPVAHPRFFAVGMLTAACRTVFSAEREAIAANFCSGPEDVKKYVLSHGGKESKSEDGRQTYLMSSAGLPHLVAFINNLLSLWMEFSARREQFVQLTLLLSRLARLGPEMRKLFLCCGLLGALFEHLAEAPTEVFSVVLSSRKCVEFQKSAGYSLGFEKILPKLTSGSGPMRRSFTKSQLSSLGVMRRFLRKLRFFIDLFSHVLLPL